MDKNIKVMCSDWRCGWTGLGADVLSAPHPFQEGCTIQGCPKCKETETIRLACDEPECWKEASCGFSTPAGYRHTCGEHWVKE